jgi:hypothetical protein
MSVFKALILLVASFWDLNEAHLVVVTEQKINKNNLQSTTSIWTKNPPYNQTKK